MVKVHKSHQPRTITYNLDEIKANKINQMLLDVPKLKNDHLPHQRSYSDLLRGREKFIPYVSEDDLKRRESALIKNIKKNEKTLKRLQAIRDPSPGKETEADLDRRIRILKLKSIINDKITKLQMINRDFQKKEETKKKRREINGAIIAGEVIRLENKIVPKKFKHQPEIDKVFSKPRTYDILETVDFKLYGKNLGFQDAEAKAVKLSKKFPDKVFEVRSSRQ